MKSRYCNGFVHVVKSGDTLYLISRKYRVPLALILRANPYVDVYNLQPNQEICIPMVRPMPRTMPARGEGGMSNNMPDEMPNEMQNNNILSNNMDLDAGLNHVGRPGEIINPTAPETPIQQRMPPQPGTPMQQGVPMQQGMPPQQGMPMQSGTPSQQGMPILTEMPMESEMPTGPIIPEPITTGTPQPAATPVTMMSNTDSESAEMSNEPDMSGAVQKEAYITDATKSLGEILAESKLSLEDFEKNNDLSQVMLAENVVLYLPKKV